MQASRVHILPATMRRASMPLDYKKKRILREQIVIELIKSRPAGTRITLADIMRQTQLKYYGSANNLIKSMVNQGKIVKTPLDYGGGYSYTVNDVVITQPRKPKFNPSKVKGNYNEEVILSLISSRPAGSNIKYREFREATGIKYDQTVMNILDRLIAKGKIIRKPFQGRGYTFSLAEPTKPTSEDFEEVETPTTEPAAITVPAAQELPKKETDITQLAKDFFWETQSDSLREFVAWLDKKGGTDSEV